MDGEEPRTLRPQQIAILTDDEWEHVEPLIPPAKRGGNKRHVEVREVMNGKGRSIRSRRNAGTSKMRATPSPLNSAVTRAPPVG